LINKFAGTKLTKHFLTIIKNKFNMKTILQIVLVIIILALGYFIYASIMEPVNFNKETAKREAQIIEKLRTIADAQVAHRTRYGVFTSDLDSLVNFIKNDSISAIVAIGNVPEGMTEEEAVKQGIVKRITNWNSVKSQVFAGKSFPVEELPFVPFGESERFNMDASTLERGMIIVPVFEAFTTPDVYMKDLKYKIYYTRMDGLKVGSLVESHVNGNWE
jgi:uncharacterized protein YpmB